jgi:colanic acid/amylovoran biosynthesis glycosyltransferase
MKHVIIFRHQLFKLSEPFISQQAEALTQCRPIYLGRGRFGGAPEGALSFAIEDIERQRSFSRRLWQVVSRDPGPYMELLAGRRPALVHAHFGVDGVYALPLARKLKVPLVTTFHGFDATTNIGALLRSGSPSWINYALFRRQLAREGDVFLCVSEYIRQRVIELGFPEERTHVHYIGIDTQAIHPRDPAEERPVVLHVARLVEKKGTEYLIRAFAKVAPQFPEVELVIVGDGPLRGPLENLAHGVGMASRARFLGARPHTEVMTLIKQATMLVLPSVTAKTGDAEGLGMVLLEGAAQGIPLIGTRHGGIPEAIEDGKTGYLVLEREVDLLGARMHELLDDAGLRHEMGHKARSLIESRFDIQKQTKKLESYYNLVLSHENIPIRS